MPPLAGAMLGRLPLLAWGAASVALLPVRLDCEMLRRLGAQ